MPEGRCPFCRIASGDMPSPVVYQDEKVIVTLDIRPANKGHMIVFPKEHYDVIFQMPRKVYHHLFSVARLAALALLNSITPDGVNLVTRSGRAAGQSVMHASIHIVPRNEGDNVSVGWQGREVSQDELESVRNQIRSFLKGQEKRLEQAPAKQTKSQKPKKRPRETGRRQGGKREKVEEKKSEKEEEESRNIKEYRRDLP